MTPDLVLAARSCVEWRIRLYCWLGFDVNVRDYEGNTPLMIAAGRAQIPAIKILLEYGADVALTDNHGWTAAHFAVAQNQFKVSREKILDVLKNHGTVKPRTLPLTRETSGQLTYRELDEMKRTLEQKKANKVT
eukprot:UN01234